MPPLTLCGIFPKSLPSIAFIYQLTLNYQSQKQLH